MPLADPDAQARRGPVRYTEAQIEALVAFVGSIGSGPDTPHVDTAAGDTANGGVLYRLNCAACHVASAAGCRRSARDVRRPTCRRRRPTQVGQAIVIGPGAMPVFGTFTPEDINDVATYVEALDAREHDRRLEVRWGRAGGRRTGRMAARPDPAGRPDPLDRTSPRGRMTADDRQSGRPTRRHRRPSARCPPGQPRAYRAAIVSFIVAPIGGVLAAVGYWSGSTESLLGIGLAAVPRRHRVRARVVGQVPRLRRGRGAAARAAAHHRCRTRRLPRRGRDDEADGGQRAGLLVALFAGSLASLVVGFVGPIGSLGPKPRGERARTNWAAGRRLVTSDGQPIAAERERARPARHRVPRGIRRCRRRPGDRPAGAARVADRRAPRPERSTAGSPTRRSAPTPDARSGCSASTTAQPQVVRELVCPCHQSSFDPLDAAKPVAGPAPRSLPQLPLAVDDEGFLVAAGAVRPSGRPDRLGRGVR